MTKTQGAGLVLIAAVSFASGRWLAPTKVVTEIKTVEVEKNVDTKNSDTDQDKHVDTTTTEVVKPDGTKETTTHTTVDTQKNQKTNESDTFESSKTSDQTKEITRQTSKVTISALAGINVTNFIAPPSYGGQLYSQVLGPIGLGLGAMTNGSVFMSVGLSF